METIIELMKSKLESELKVLHSSIIENFVDCVCGPKDAEGLFWLINGYFSFHNFPEKQKTKLIGLLMNETLIDHSLLFELNSETLSDLKQVVKEH